MLFFPWVLTQFCVISTIVWSLDLHSSVLEGVKRLPVVDTLPVDTSLVDELPFHRLPAVEFLPSSKSVPKVNQTAPESALSENGAAPLIVGGKNATDGQFPWMVALYYSNRTAANNDPYQFICSSFLVSLTYVMTAAHCVVLKNDKTEPATNYIAKAGNVDRTKGTTLRFSNVSSHPNYKDANTEYDIALLKLTNAVQPTTNLQPICLFRTGGALDTDLKTIEAMGWGLTSNDRNESAPVILKTTNLTVTPQLQCEATYRLLNVAVTRRHICTGSEQGTGVCFGDSGGPAVLSSSNSQPGAVGVVSFAAGICANREVPTVDTRVPSYIDFVNQTVGQADGICFVTI